MGCLLRLDIVSDLHVRSFLSIDFQSIESHHAYAVQYNACFEAFWSGLASVYSLWGGCCNTFGRINVSVSLSCSFSDLWKPWPSNSVLGMLVISSECLVQARISMSSGQGQGYRDKNRTYTTTTKCRGWSAFDWKAILFEVFDNKLYSWLQTVWLWAR